MKKVKVTDADPNIGTLQVDEELVTNTSQKAETSQSFSVMQDISWQKNLIPQVKH